MGKVICDHADKCLCDCPHIVPHDYYVKCQPQPCTRGAAKVSEGCVKCIPVPVKEGDE